MRPSRRQAALMRRQRESRVTPSPLRPGTVDWRASCLRCERARDWYASTFARVRWVALAGPYGMA
jgi:hypothetical protein